MFARTRDVALMNDDPRKLVEFIELSRATQTVLWQNIALALGTKVVFLTLALAGQATLWMAVFADMGGSLLVVFNGLRLLRKARRPCRHRRCYDRPPCDAPSSSSCSPYCRFSLSGAQRLAIASTRKVREFGILAITRTSTRVRH